MVRIRQIFFNNLKNQYTILRENVFLECTYHKDSRQAM